MSYDVPDGFKIIVADPPWPFSDKLPGPKRGAASHYKTLRIEELQGFLHMDLNLPVAADAWLFLWRVAAMQEDALLVAENWGFTVKSELVWFKTIACKKCDGVGWTPRLDPPCPGEKLWCEACEGRGYKTRIGMGRTVRNSHETCLIATRGRPQTADHSIPSFFFAPRTEHSTKPDVFFKIVERLTGNVAPRIELFARKRRPGWEAHGLELPPATEATA